MILPMFRPAAIVFACAAAIVGASAARSAGTATDADPSMCRTTAQLLNQAACWWATYMDPYFGVTIDYPADLLRPGPSYAEGAGHRFASKDGALILSVWGARAAETLSITETMATDLYRSGFQSVTDQRADAAGYIIGGRHGAREFLKRVRWAEPDGKVVETACITWPTVRDDEFRPLAEKIASTLRNGRGWALNPRARLSNPAVPEGSCRGL